MRGYACVALHMPKTTMNIGSAMRAAFCYDARLIVTSGKRYSPVPADTMKAYRHIPFLQADDVFDAIPYDCVPVAVDLVEGAHPLPRYVHPERAFYVFGPEDGTLSRAITDRCRDAIMVPTRFCMNLAATVNVVLYDRMAKAQIAATAWEAKAVRTSNSDESGDASQVVGTRGLPFTPSETARRLLTLTPR